MDDLRYYVLFNSISVTRIMKGCVQWNPAYGWEEFASSGAQTEDRYISRPALNPLSYRGFSFQRHVHPIYCKLFDTITLSICTPTCILSLNLETAIIICVRRVFHSLSLWKCLKVFHIPTVQKKSEAYISKNGSALLVDENIYTP